MILEPNSPEKPRFGTITPFEPPDVIDNRLVRDLLGSDLPLVGIAENHRASAFHIARTVNSEIYEELFKAMRALAAIRAEMTLTDSRIAAIHALTRLAQSSTNDLAACRAATAILRYTAPTPAATPNSPSNSGGTGISLPVSVSTPEAPARPTALAHLAPQGAAQALHNEAQAQRQADIKTIDDILARAHERLKVSGATGGLPPVRSDDDAAIPHPPMRHHDPIEQPSTPELDPGLSAVTKPTPSCDIPALKSEISNFKFSPSSPQTPPPPNSPSAFPPPPSAFSLPAPRAPPAATAA